MADQMKFARFIYSMTLCTLKYHWLNDFEILKKTLIFNCVKLGVVKMIELLENINLDGYVTVVSSVSVGNVGQLACDLLIYSTNMKKFGYVWHPSVLPLAGPDPYGKSNEPATGCELYISPTLKLIVFQIRSAITKSKFFIEELVVWLKSNNVKQVIILAGSSAHERRDKQLMNEPLRFVFCPLTKKQELGNAKARNWIELEQRGETIDLSNNKSLSHISGSGLAVKLFNHCMNEKIPCSILLSFCSEGDNIPDALKLAEYFNEWIQVKEELNIANWTIPPSWRLLFGSRAPLEIFN